MELNLLTFSGEQMILSNIYAPYKKFSKVNIFNLPHQDKDDF